MLQAIISLRFHCPALGLLHQHGSITQEIPLTQKDVFSGTRKYALFKNALNRFFIPVLYLVANLKKMPIVKNVPSALGSLLLIIEPFHKTTVFAFQSEN